jgi:hypothetical protein
MIQKEKKRAKKQKGKTFFTLTFTTTMVSLFSNNPCSTAALNAFDCGNKVEYTDR